MKKTSKKNQQKQQQSPEQEEKKEEPKSPKKNPNKNIEQEPIVKEKKLEKFNLDYIYRREKYTLKNLMSNFLVSGIKKLIAKNLNLDIEIIKIFYKSEELTNPKQNVYDLIKNDKIKYFEVKKEVSTNNEIFSLNSNEFNYKVQVSKISDVIDLDKQIELFFKEILVEKKYICEPVSMDTYHVCFLCEDYAYQFKRFCIVLKRNNKLYSNIDISVILPEKNYTTYPELIDLEKKNKIPMFIDKGPYITEEDRRKMEEKDSKKRWVSDKNFVLYSKA